jgi:hypothetical protein
LGTDSKTMSSTQRSRLRHLLLEDGVTNYCSFAFFCLALNLPSDVNGGRGLSEAQKIQICLLYSRGQETERNDRLWKRTSFWNCDLAH